MPCTQAPSFFYNKDTNAMHAYGNAHQANPGEYAGWAMLTVDENAKKYFINGPQDQCLTDGSPLFLHKEGKHTIQYFNMGHVSD